ncbi:MFS transporter [Notoacmeibacter sp. MSK16QG-6]|uniref:MFS transporter n=1 Tax=Notoacmeibacter sp. MSK16QG-6 TaxID=2957982 RepID=UPI00209F952B|nr:MFS transporter [Notoacmeibacter sp. MSK16QG-6]MCP1198311.1 hypothetical protein [Notoacmeibacter sp. MSK16QG-6]
MKNTLAPALIGHGFQQTALMAMLPMIASHFDLSYSAVGMAVAFGMLAATLTIPLVGLTDSAALLRPSLAVMIICSAGLALLLASPVAPAAALAGLLALRLCQGAAAATLLIHAQIVSLSEKTGSRGHLARTQSFAGIGRAISAVCVGPLAAMSIVLPVVPAIAGAIWSLLKTRPERANSSVRCRGVSLMPPHGRGLVLPFTVQVSLGVTHVSLAPLLAAQPRFDDLSAAAVAGLALSAANIGLLLAHRFLTARLDLMGMRAAAMAGAAAIMSIALMPTPPVVIGLSACVGAASAMLLTYNLHCAFHRSGQHGTSQTAWNATVSTGGLAVGAFAGSASLAAGPGLSLTLAAIAMALALPALSMTRTSTS